MLYKYTIGIFLIKPCIHSVQVVEQLNIILLGFVHPRIPRGDFARYINPWDN